MPHPQKDTNFKTLGSTEKKTLENHFVDSIGIASRNSAIIKALNDGYTQGEIARYLGLVVGRHLTLLERDIL